MHILQVLLSALSCNCKRSTGKLLVPWRFWRGLIIFTEGFQRMKTCFCFSERGSSHKTPDHAELPVLFVCNNMLTFLFKWWGKKRNCCSAKWPFSFLDLMLITVNLKPSEASVSFGSSLFPSSVCLLYYISHVAFFSPLLSFYTSADAGVWSCNQKFGTGWSHWPHETHEPNVVLKEKSSVCLNRFWISSVIRRRMNGPECNILTPLRIENEQKDAIKHR